MRRHEATVNGSRNPSPIYEENEEAELMAVLNAGRNADIELLSTVALVAHMAASNNGVLSSFV